MRELSFVQALAEALDEVLTEDERVTLIGAGFTGFVPSRAMLDPVRKKFEHRTKYPPISELAFCGIGAGAAMAGDVFDDGENAPLQQPK